MSTSDTNPKPPFAVGSIQPSERRFGKLHDYLSGLDRKPTTNAHLWRDADGKTLGRYFNSTLTSVFQPIRALDTGDIAGFQGYLRSHSETDSGLSLWRLLDYAASDEESIELDRLCRLLHTVNFFRQPEASERDLYLNVHARLLAAVEDNHGHAFRRALASIDVPHRRIVLQLPAITQNLSWLLDSVVTNYRSNGFRIAVNSSRVKDALGLLNRVQPDVVKLDIRSVTDATSTEKLLQLAQQRGVQVVFKRVDSHHLLRELRQTVIHLARRYWFRGTCGTCRKALWRMCRPPSSPPPRWRRDGRNVMQTRTGRRRGSCARYPTQTLARSSPRTRHAAVFARRHRQSRD